MDVKTYIVSYAFLTRDNKLICNYSGSYAKVSVANKHKEDLEKVLKQDDNIIKYDIDVVATIIPHGEYKMGMA